MTIFGPAESFKMMNRPDPTRLGPTVMLFNSLFLRKYERYGPEILTQSSFSFSICAIKF